ncbi:MAG: amidohydrolase [Oscillospiraceae bacterium]|nr:amidohydrolase [Oscillospiraceae bacterium]
MLIVNGVVLTMEGNPIENGYVAFENGKITSVGAMPDAPGADTPGADGIFDARGGYILPGFVDAHCHIGISGDSFESDDCNEMTDPVTPQLRAIDGVNPFDRYFAESAAAGITSVMTGPGSANAIAGSFIAMKTVGRRADEMALLPEACMKFALGENPKITYSEKHETPTTRMATAALIREALNKAREYGERLRRAEVDLGEDAPDYDAKSEALLPVLRREKPAHFHAHRADDILTAIRIAKEFNLDYVIVHGTDGHLIADILAEEGARVITGPLMTDRSKPELYNQTLKNPGILAAAGVKVAICTDHPETPLEYLPLSAAMAVKAGMDENEALRAITINAAEIAGIADRVGSLKPGKDADIVVMTGSPFSIDSKIQAVYIDGKKI